MILRCYLLIKGDKSKRMQERADKIRALYQMPCCKKGCIYAMQKCPTNPRTFQWIEKLLNECCDEISDMGKVDKKIYLR
jgi:hypothetical protein